MITDAHKAFLQAFIALAREHGMNHISITFDDASSKNFLANKPLSDRVTATWSEGRHGMEASVNVETRAVENIPEA
jgi:hypothetical protein